MTSRKLLLRVEPVTLHSQQSNIMLRSYCIALTSFQEHICKIKRPEPQEAIFRARATERWGHTDTIDGNACIWSTQSQTNIFMLLFSFNNHCPALNFKTGFLFHLDFERTCLQRRFLPAVCMQLLCRLQPPDVFDYNMTVVNFEDITIPTTGISVGKQSRRRKVSATNFRWELCLLGCCEKKKQWFDHLQC